MWTFWKSYWFAPAPLFNLACCRLLLVGVELLLSVGREFYQVVSYTAHNAPMMVQTRYSPPLVYKLLTLPFGEPFLPSEFLLSVIFVITMGAGLSAFVGLFTNLSLIVFVVGQIFMRSFNYSFGEFHHVQAVMMIALAILALSPCGRVLSVDDLLRRLSVSAKQRKFIPSTLLEESSEFARWPVLLMQWIFALCYFSSFLSKMRYSGFEWANGFTLQYYLARDGLRWNSSLGLWFADHHWLAWLSQWTALVFQGTFFLIVIFPILRWVYIPLGFTFHIVVYLTMRAPFFTWMAMYGVFVNWKGALTKFSSLFFAKPEKLEVLYDGQCPLCIRSMTILQYGDWFERIRYSNVLDRWDALRQERQIDIPLSEFLREMYLVMPDGSLRKGFFAFQELVKVVPLFWFAVPFFYLPFASTIGPKVYKLVSSRRRRFEDCTFDTCASTKHKYSKP
ncbi:DCC1-like thiol-disulfide oxidoreductase family protein [Candidatus Nitrospira salsa]